MPRVFFMRHAKTNLNKEGKFAGRIDCDVTEEGLQATRDSFPYKDEDFDYIYISPLKRTRQTLDAAIPNHKEPIVDERIIERDVGDWDGKPYDIISDSLRENYIKGFIDPPGGESAKAIKQRVTGFVEDLFSKYGPNDRILVVSHGAVLREIRDNFLPQMPKEPIKNSQILEVDDAVFGEYITQKNKKLDADAR